MTAIFVFRRIRAGVRFAGRFFAALFGSLLMLACAGASGADNSPLRFTTLAGDGSAGDSDGDALAAEFNSPSSVAVDAAGSVYVADSSNHTIRKLTRIGARWVASTVAGSSGNSGLTDGTGTAAQFNFPSSLAIDAAGIIYVADTFNNAIRKITQTGADAVVTTLAGGGPSGAADGVGRAARFNFPEGIAVGPGNAIYVADSFNNAIRQLTPVGTNWNVSTVAGQGAQPGSVDGPNTVARFNSPTGIAVDAAGNIFVADNLNQTIREITPAGVVSTIAGSPGISGFADGIGSAARFNDPAGVALDATGNLLIADSSNHTLRWLSGAGATWTTTTLAGSPGVAGSADGDGAAARFNLPYGVTVDQAGAIYVADSGNNLVRLGQTASVNVQPAMQITLSGAQIFVSWPGSATNYLLEATSVLGPGATWRPLTNGISVIFGQLNYAAPASGAAGYFRLRQP